MQTSTEVRFGIGLRPNHYQEIIDTKPPVDWFEIVSEDFMVDGGSPLFYLDQVRLNYPMAMHGVSLSIGSCDPLDWDYLKKLKSLMERVEPLWVSDHLCWTGVNGVNIHDLMPLPHTEECLNHVVDRVKAVQDYLGQRILLENVSSYVSYQASILSEWEFLSAVAEQADCYILLDINNVFVNAFNHGFNPLDYLHHLPSRRVKQFHLAGHHRLDTHIIDTHDAPIVNDVWDLYSKAVQCFGSAAVLIERDANIPPISELIDEMNRARAIHQQIEVSCVNTA